MFCFDLGGIGMLRKMLQWEKYLKYSDQLLHEIPLGFLPLANFSSFFFYDLTITMFNWANVCMQLHHSEC